jgi:hypothetical protein
LVAWKFRQALGEWQEGTSDEWLPILGKDIKVFVFRKREISAWVTFLKGYLDDKHGLHKDWWRKWRRTP